MSRDPRVAITRIGYRMDHTPVDRKTRRRLRRTGRGPAGPSEKARERMRRRAV